MLDVKSWDEKVYNTLTGGEISPVRKNLSLLAEMDKLEEIRIVCLENIVDVEETIQEIAKTIGERRKTVPLKLIQFRNQGVRGKLSNASPPGKGQMEKWREVAEKEGFYYIRII